MRTYEADEDYVEIDPETYSRLIEWARWAKQRAWLSACRSIEGRYIPPAAKVLHDDPKPLPVNALQAWAMECTWRTALPFLERMMLRGYFITAPSGHRGSHAWPGHVRALCRKHGVRRKDFALVVARAVRMMENRLRSQAIARTMRSVVLPHQLPVRDATGALPVSASQKQAA